MLFNMHTLYIQNKKNCPVPLTINLYIYIYIYNICIRFVLEHNEKFVYNNFESQAHKL